MKAVINDLLLRNLPDLAAFSLVLLIEALGVWLLFRGPARNAPPWGRRIIWIGAACSACAVVLAFLLRFARVARHFPYWWFGWGRGLLVCWALLMVLLVAAFAISRLLPHAGPGHSPARRNLLRGVRVVLFGAPAVALGYGAFIERVNLQIREQDIAVPGLHPDLDGLRLVQLSDIHLSPFVSERDLERAIAMANETRAHVALVTGDMITSGSDPLDLCLRHLARLRADAGIFGCMGNHEIYADAEDYAEQRGAALGLHFLRMANAPLRFGNATLNLAGVDYQRMHTQYLRGAEKLVQPGAFNVLMSHNPDVFPVAARQGYQFTLAGHTHGGQIRVEILREDLNVARFFTRYVDGLYREGPSSIFVSRGIGTIALPVRLGAPPEVALLKLCRI